MNRETKLKAVIAVLSLLLLASAGYIAVGKISAAQAEKLRLAATQGYNTGVADALATAYLQTNNCQVTTIFLGNATRRIVDVDCVQRALAEQQAAAQPATS